MGAISYQKIFASALTSDGYSLHIFADFIIDGVGIARILKIGADEPLLGTRNPMPPIAV